MTVLLCMTVLQVSVAAFSVYVLSGVRAYVTGESLYSKGQKDAQIYLLDYAANHREEDYLKLRQALAVPIADRRAREALQQPDPDIAAARQAFVDGGNHPDDVAALVYLFLWFSKTPLMAPAIETWTEGDHVIEQMHQLVERTRNRVLAGQTDGPALREIRTEAPALNRHLTELESRFSAQLGESSRRAQTLLLALNVALAALLITFGVGFVRRMQRIQALTEAEVVRRQESLQTLLDSAAEGLFGVDTEGRCTFVNRAALRLLGYAHESDLLGRPILETVVHRTLDAADAPPGLDAPQHCDQEVFRRRDGSSFPVERWSHPMWQDGRLQGAVTTFFDISEPLRLRSELKREQILMERLVGAVTDAVITYGDDLHIRVFNATAERLFLTGAADALGSPVGRLFDGGLPPPQTLVGEPPGRLHELTGRRTDGTTFHLEASFSRIETDEGTLHTAVLRDVTAREQMQAERRARERLETTNRTKTEFLSRMSHELRTPLNAVIGFAQLLRVDSQQPPTLPQLERIRHIERAGAHLLALVDDVLDLSRIESGHMAITTEAVELGAAAEEAATLVSPLVTRAGVELFVAPASSETAAGAQLRLFARGAPASNELCARADPVRLRQVLVNLLSNAVKYNRSGGHVWLSWRVDGETCEITVADDGPGMSADKLERLYEPFNRLGAETSGIEGTGIGLVLSRRLTEMMGGTLRIASRVGEGTVATLSLPNSEPALAAPVRSPLLPQPQRAACPDLDVLYAEDNEVNAELVRQALALRPSVTLRIAPSGREALMMARERPPDLMLVDMHLGDMSGLALAQALRNGSTTQRIEMIALSADALPEQIDTAMRHGFQDYLTKPVDFRRLLRVIDEHRRLPMTGS